MNVHSMQEVSERNADPIDPIARAVEVHRKTIANSEVAIRETELQRDIEIRGYQADLVEAKQTMERLIAGAKATFETASAHIHDAIERSNDLAMAEIAARQKMKRSSEAALAALADEPAVKAAKK